MNKSYRFFYHFNKAHKAMTVHFRGQCLIAKNVKCSRPAETHWQNKQPMLIMRGFANNVIIENEIAYID